MTRLSNDVKQRYFEKVYENAQVVECACGCSEQIKNRDKYGRVKSFVNGHNNKKYLDPTQYKREWNYRNRAARQIAKMKRHRKIKVDCLLHKGSKCEDCAIAYNGKNAAIFHFHHLDPATKDFAVGNQVVNKAWSTILAELDKCILLCANCHELRHSSEF